MGKVKYMSVYKDSTYSYSTHKKKYVRMTVANCPIPRLALYHRLMAYIKSIDIGKLYSIHDTLCEGLNEHEWVSGCYRELEELLLILAEFYLSSNLYNICSDNFVDIRMNFDNIRPFIITSYFYTRETKKWNWLDHVMF